MATVELKMLCVLLFAAFASAEVKPMTDFDVEQFAGKWYRVALATNFTSSKTQIKMGTAMMVPNKDGDIALTFTELKSDGSCFRRNNFFQKTEIPGHFVFTTNAGAKGIDMCVVDGKFNDYVILHIIMTEKGESVVLNQIHSRTTTITDELKEKFRQLCLDTGIPEENIVMLEKNGEC